MCVCNYIKFYECFLSLEAVVFVCMHVDECELETLDVWGELEIHKISLTLHTSSQGWDSRCP